MTTQDKLADALRDIVTMLRDNPKMQGREYIDLGIAANNALRAYDTALAEHDSTSAAPDAPAPVQVDGLTCVPNLQGDARLAHDQCRAVAHMARALAEVHEARMSILATGHAPVEVIGQSSAEIMEWLGDALSGMDACDESDEWMDPVFDAAQARWPIAAPPPPALPEVTDEDVGVAGRAFDRTGNKPTVGTFRDGIRAALESYRARLMAKAVPNG